MRDVFISYSHRDGEWVRNVLLPRLEARGFSVVIDFRDFKAGAFSVEQMEKAVQECRRLLVILTPAYIESEWARLENVMAQVLDPAAVQRKIIPAMRVKCEIPLRLRVLHYRSLVTDDGQEWERLISDLM
jgi:hypothetical protein